MRILCVNHIGAVSGAERSLLDLMAALHAIDDVRLSCPRSGPLAAAAAAASIPVMTIPKTEGSLKLHARETPRALLGMSAAAALVARHARRMGAEVIHANSVRAGLFAVAAARATGIPAVVHVRDRLPRSAIADLSLRWVAAGARTIVANSRYTADGVRAVTARGRLRVVHNAVDLRRFDPWRVDRAAARERLGLTARSFVLGVVGQITPWKGQREALLTLARLRDDGRPAQLLIAGEPKFVAAATRYDNRSYHAELQRIIADHGLADVVSLLGERDDVPAVMSALDALLVPSWEEPFGRVVVEGMALRLPVIATRVGGPAEIITDGVDGLLLDPRDVPRWAAVIGELMDSPSRRAQLGEAARARAAAFALPGHVAEMRTVYEEAVGS